MNKNNRTVEFGQRGTVFLPLYNILLNKEVSGEWEGTLGCDVA
jgi:hypothetical protein